MLDTTPAFAEFAREAFKYSPVEREVMWRERYEAAHRDVFDAFHAALGERRTPLVRELSALRRRAEEAAPVIAELAEELDPRVAELLGVESEASPLHVLVVGASSTSAVVGRVGDDVALFHCLEWYRSREGARTLVAHEDTHAWHQIRLGLAPPENDVAWTAFYEGLALRASRQLVPDQPEQDYFWYGYEGFEEWLPWCRERRDTLLETFRASLDDPGAVESFFGGGLVEGQWRVGFFVADEIVGGIGHSVAELAALSVEEAVGVVHSALEGPAH